MGLVEIPNGQRMRFPQSTRKLKSPHSRLRLILSVSSQHSFKAFGFVDFVATLWRASGEFRNNPSSASPFLVSAIRRQSPSGRRRAFWGLGSQQRCLDELFARSPLHVWPIGTHVA